MGGPSVGSRFRLAANYEFTCAHRSFISVATLAVAILLLSVGSLFAASDACDGLSTAKPNELLALPEADMISRDWLPPGVSCTSEDPDHTPEMCSRRMTIAQDRMIGDYRLIVATAASGDVPPNQNSTDYVFVFTCIAGRIRAVTHAPFYNSQDHDYSQYASPHTSRAYSSGLPREFRPKYPCPMPPPVVGLYHGVPFVKAPPPSDRLCTPAKEMLACGDLPAASVDQLLGLRGAGCYPDDQSKCDWYVTLREDRMVTDARRLIDIKATYRVYRRPWCSDQVNVFGCVNGEARKVFEYRFSHVKRIEGGADRLVIVSWSSSPQELALHAHVGVVPNETPPSLSWEKRRTYSWDAKLQSYILRGVHFGPPPPGQGLPPSAPPCADPAAGETGSSSPR